jgi:pimeloyl-ACP methyl ester carboxylesterase
VRVTTDDGVTLEVAVRGRGPGLVLVHGYGGAKEDFADHVADLARDHTVVTPDLRGHGGSDGPDDEDRYSLDRFAADLGCVLDELQLDRVRLLGHSMGGMVARRFVLDRPERVEALVLMDTSPGPVPGMDAEIMELGAQIAMDDGMDELKRVMDAFSPLGTPAYERSVAERPQLLELERYKWSRLSRAMYVRMMREIRDQPDQLGALAGVTCPTLVMVGEQDRPFLDVSGHMAATIPAADLVVVPDAGHSPQFENPAAWLLTVRTFLARVAAATPA